MSVVTAFTAAAEKATCLFRTVKILPCMGKLRKRYKKSLWRIVFDESTAAYLRQQHLGIQVTLVVSVHGWRRSRERILQPQSAVSAAGGRNPDANAAPVGVCYGKKPFSSFLQNHGT